MTLLVFALAVWGLHYKLSLYHLSSVHARTPVAKLLSQKERPAYAQADDTFMDKSAGPAIHQTAPNVLVLLLLPTLNGRWPQNGIVGSQHVSPLRPLAIAQHLGARPPPDCA